MTDRLRGNKPRWCFSTLGCDDLSFAEICELAAESNIPGIELRGMGGRMDMAHYCAQEGLTPARMQALCGEHHVQLVVAGSSLKLTSASETDREELLTLCAWAETRGIPYVRVFGGGTWGEPLTDRDYANACEFMNGWQQLKVERQWHVELLLETHDAFSASESCLELNRRLTQPLNLIWDSHHTWRIGGESLEFTWSRIGPFVRHVHVKDSVDRPSARHPHTYVLPGAGQMPMGDVISLLQQHQFEGFVSLEWERKWHPYLPPLHEALRELKAQAWFEGTIDELAPTASAH